MSAEAQQIALPGSTYGLDVVVRIGWLRQEGRFTSVYHPPDLTTHGK